jgi:hypothetical protein
MGSTSVLSSVAITTFRQQGLEALGAGASNIYTY